MSERREPDPQAKAEDPEQYHQRRRLKAIADAREKAIRQHQELPEKTELTELGKEYAMFTAVQAYVLEIEQLIHHHGTAEYYDTLLGEITIPTPDEFMKKPDREDNEPIKHTDEDSDLRGHGYPKLDGGLPQPETEQITGLVSRVGSQQRGFADLPPILTVTWDIGANISRTERGTIEGENSQPIPWHLSIKAMKLANQFCAEVGLDTDMVEDGTDVEIKYDDII